MDEAGETNLWPPTGPKLKRQSTDSQLVHLTSSVGSATGTQSEISHIAASSSSDSAARNAADDHNSDSDSDAENKSDLQDDCGQDDSLPNGPPTSNCTLDIKHLRRLDQSHMPPFDRCLERPFSTGRPVWDSSHVRMPYADSRPQRWSQIQSLLDNILNNIDLESLSKLQDLILKYNDAYRNKWDFGGLNYYLDQLQSDEKFDILSTLYSMGKLAARLQEICPQPIPLLKNKGPGLVTLSKKQIACLLANAFFCTFPMRNQKPKSRGHSAPLSSDMPRLPTINFSGLFKFPAKGRGTPELIQNKLKCIMNYFRRVTDDKKEPRGYVTFERRVISGHEVDWKNSRTLFTELYVTSGGSMEDEGHGMLQVDFANKLVGGGVLGRGCVQEEIKFLGFPELIVSRLFTEELDDTECLIVSGCEKYNTYSGYSDGFKWVSDFVDETACDEHGRRLAQIALIDATRFYNRDNQFAEYHIRRELNKAFCGFHGDGNSLPTIATGNWGCGDFRGDRHLKSLIQLMAAAEAGRDVCYFTHRDAQLVDDLFKVHDLIRCFQLTVGDVKNIIDQFVKKLQVTSGMQPLNGLFPYIFETYMPLIDTPS